MGDSVQEVLRMFCAGAEAHLKHTCTLFSRVLDTGRSKYVEICHFSGHLCPKMPKIGHRSGSGYEMGGGLHEKTSPE